MLATVTDWLWSYVLIAALLLVGLRLTWDARFVQLRLFKEMSRGLSGGFTGTDKGLSSFQALVVSVAGRVGGGNIAGVAVAITLGGPGALFWMWLIALIGMATSLFECALAQLYKQSDGSETYRGGPAYFMRFGLGWNVMPVIYSALLLVTIGFGFNAVQTYSVTNSIESAFDIPTWQSGLVLTAVMAAILFGGIRRLATVSQVIVPIMVAGYFLLAMGILIANITEVPAALGLIFKSAFGIEQVVGGGVAAAIMQGARRGLFSNEAGLGTVPNVAATADVQHPIQQGLVQSLSVFIDTIILCTCTALIILLVLFATTTIAYNCYLGENSIAYFANRPAWAIPAFRISVLMIIAWASVQDLGTVFSFSDLTMALLAITNLLALWYLAPIGMKLLKDFETQLREGSAPVFKRETLPGEKIDERSWS
jgi:AGCS family alanine or glycine:cation symporter